MVYKARTCYPRAIALLRQSSAAPQQRAHPQERDMRTSSSRSLSDRTPLWAVRDLLQGIDKILAHGNTHACVKVRAGLSSVSNTAVMHSSNSLPGLTHGEKTVPYSRTHQGSTEHLRIVLGTRSSPSV